jgi:HSP20 family protein
MTDQTKTLEVREQGDLTYEGERTRDRYVYVPRADIYETVDAIVVITDLPGAAQKDVEITLEKNVLTIHASLAEKPMEGYSMVYSEFQCGDYERRFVLSNTIDQEKIEARVKDGVLYLRLAKAAPVKVRKIDIKIG